MSGLGLLYKPLVRVASSGLFIVAFIVGCGEDPPPLSPDAKGSVTSADGSVSADATLRLDSGLWDLPDSGTERADQGIQNDASETLPDAMGSLQDAMTSLRDANTSVDAGFPEDAAAVDASQNQPDSGPSDSGPTIGDDDNDTISNQDETNGIIDTDADQIPDSLDTDSDNDGIPDDVEAGDADLSTPPVDTDGDGLPDFRDQDSDGDGVFDRVEGGGDLDMDGIPNFRDDDSDGDGILDRDEGGGDLDMDGIPDNLDPDTDGDGIDNSVEGAGDADNDGTPNYLDLDSDGDGIADAIETINDADNDGSPNFLDEDSDGDTIPDRVETTVDTDNDNIPNYLDEDSDGDTIRDDHDGVIDSDNDGTPNYLDLDSDEDSLSDAVEAGDAIVQTPPRDSDFDRTADFADPDSDNDGIGDFHEGTADTDNDTLLDRFDIDSDSDSILDDVEGGDNSTITPPLDTDSDGVPDFRDTDSDNDTILDLTEGNVDSDNDTIANFRDSDSDSDSWSDADEAGDTNLFTPPADTDSDLTPDYLDLDSDEDGLADSAELGCPGSSERALSDSDSDTYPDPAEIAYGSDPCGTASIIDDFYFFLPPSGPQETDTLVFNNTNIDRADMTINIDTTGSMGGEIANLRASLSGTIIPGVSAVIPDIATGVSSFEDYPIFPFGSSVDGDVPFRLGTRVTTDVGVAQTAVNGLATRNGFDVPESGIESLYQIATGAGTSWNGGSVPAFNPAQNQVTGVADGTIGGVGFRDDSLPIIVHVTDAPGHTQNEYGTGSQITAVSAPTTEAALSAIGARVVSIANTRMTQLGPAPFEGICARQTGTFFGRINTPIGSDVDWFELDGAVAGDVVTVTTNASRLGSTLDTVVAVFDGATQLALNDDINLTNGIIDSSVTVSLTGTGPFYIALASYTSPTGGGTAGWWFMDVVVNGNRYIPSNSQCRINDGNSSASATLLTNITSATTPINQAACIANCRTQLPQLALPYGMALATRAVIPPCAWDAFGGSRPAGCATNQCCTGIGGTGVTPTGIGNNECPLTFQIADDGTGIGDAVVTGIQALVNFSAFTITTVLRPDLVELQNSGLDTRCFLQSVIPTLATPPNMCAPQPIPVDLFPPAGQNDSWENVVPGTVLTFDVNAQNENASTGQPCVNTTTAPQLFRAYIDVIADGVTVVDTRDVIIIVPSAPPSSSN